MNFDDETGAARTLHRAPDHGSSRWDTYKPPTPSNALSSSEGSGFPYASSTSLQHGPAPSEEELLGNSPEGGAAYGGAPKKSLGSDPWGSGTGSTVSHLSHYQSIMKSITKNRYTYLLAICSLIQCIVLIIAQSLVLKQQHAQIDELESIFKLHTPVPTENMNIITGKAKALKVYQMLFILSQLFQIYLSIESIHIYSKVQLVFANLINFISFGHSLLQYYQSLNLLVGYNDPTVTAYLDENKYSGNSKIQMLEIAVISLTFLFLCIWTFLSSRVYNVFGWNQFKEMGADVNTKEQLQTFHLYVILIKIDFFLFLFFTLQYVLLVLDIEKSSAAMFWSNIILQPCVAILIPSIAYFAVIRESNTLMAFTLILLSGLAGYLVERLLDIHMGKDPKKYASCRTSLTYTEIFTLAVTVATFILAIMNFRNFGKGLMSSLKK